MNDSEANQGVNGLGYVMWPPNEYVYAREKLGVAVWKLATGVGRIKDRLADAYIELAILQETDLPPELVAEWKQIRADLTSGKMQYEVRAANGELVQQPVGLLASTLRYMRNERACGIARRICKLEAELDFQLRVEHEGWE